MSQHEKLIAQFKEQRKNKKISQEKVSELCEVSYPTVVAAELGNREPKLGTFMEMCKAIGYIVVMIPDPKAKEEVVEEPQTEEKKEIDYDNFK